VFEYLEYGADLCQPTVIHVCDGSDEENRSIMDLLVNDGMIEPLPKYDNWYIFPIFTRYVSIQMGFRQIELFLVNEPNRPYFTVISFTAHRITPTRLFSTSNI